MTVLEIGCYTGFSALAWYEATAQSQARITTLELDPKMIAASRRTFNKHGLNDRVKLIEGPAQESIEKLTGQFDLVFVDANKEGYEGYVKSLLDKKLLSPKGLILCDNGKRNARFKPQFLLILVAFSLRPRHDHIPRGKSSPAGKGSSLLDGKWQGSTQFLQFLQSRWTHRYHPFASV